MTPYRVRYRGTTPDGQVLEVEQIIEAQHADQAVERTRRHAEYDLGRAGVARAFVHLEAVAPWSLPSLSSRGLMIARLDRWQAARAAEASR
jgi:hypothetical protein